jgi:solute carrier family 35 protein E1
MGENSFMNVLNLSILFVFWYAFNAGYNVYNAYLKTDFQFPLAIAALQLGVGLLYALPLWVLGIRKMPSLTFQDFTRLLPIGDVKMIATLLTSDCDS